MVVGLKFKSVVRDRLLLSRFSMDKEMLYTKLKLSIRAIKCYQLYLVFHKQLL